MAALRLMWSKLGMTCSECKVERSDRVIAISYGAICWFCVRTRGRLKYSGLAWLPSQDSTASPRIWQDFGRQPYTWVQQQLGEGEGRGKEEQWNEPRQCRASSQAPASGDLSREEAGWGSWMGGRVQTSCNDVLLLARTLTNRCFFDA